jgi:hypothetical protein
MGEEHDARRGDRPTRRTLARGAAWSVPVIVAAAPAPAMAVSGVSTGRVTSSCEPRAQGAFTLEVAGASSDFIEVVFTRTGGGTFSVSAPAGWLQDSATGTRVVYLVPVVDREAQGTAIVTFVLGQNGRATVTATISATSGQEISGTTTASVTKRRDGNSNTYQCTSA